MFLCKLIFQLSTGQAYTSKGVGVRQRSQETNSKWEVTLILNIFPFYFCFLFFFFNLALFNHYQSCKRQMAQLCEISLLPLFLILKLINLRYHPECCQWEFPYLLCTVSLGLPKGRIHHTVSICHREACVCVFIGFLSAVSKVVQCGKAARWRRNCCIYPLLSVYRFKNEKVSGMAIKEFFIVAK